MSDRRNATKTATGYGKVLALAAIFLLPAACAETELVAQTGKNIVRSTTPEPRENAKYKVGKPYRIGNVWYYPHEDFGYAETGVASWYGPKFHGKPTANGEIFDQYALTAAHRTLPLPSLVRVTNLANGRSIVLRINDRGPFAHNRIIDVSRRGAQLLGFENQGTTKVKVEIMAEESLALKQRLLNGGVSVAQVQRATPAPRPRSEPVQAPEPIVRASAPPRQLASASPRDLTAPPAPKEPSRTVETAPAPPTVLRPASPGPVDDRQAARPPATDEDRAAIAAATTKLRSIAGTQGSPNRAAATAPRSTAAVSKPEPSPAGGLYYLQAASFSSLDNARRSVDTLSGLAPANMTPVTVNGRQFYRVRVGPVRDEASARQLLAHLRGNGYPDARLVAN